MLFCFFFNDTATTEIYTLSLHDALPICGLEERDGVAFVKAAGIDEVGGRRAGRAGRVGVQGIAGLVVRRSEEHTSELQSRQYLVCRLLLEKKKHRSHSSDGVRAIDDKKT